MGGSSSIQPLSRARLSGWRPSLPHSPARAPSPAPTEDRGGEIALAGDPPTSPKLQRFAGEGRGALCPPPPTHPPTQRPSRPAPPSFLPSPIRPSPPEPPDPGPSSGPESLRLPGRSPRSSSLLRPGCPPAMEGDERPAGQRTYRLAGPRYQARVTGLLAWHGTARLGCQRKPGRGRRRRDGQAGRDGGGGGGRAVLP